jgi:hypothetical protein
VKPLHKKENKENKSNYRQNQFSNFLKILEYREKHNFYILQKNKFQSKNQYSFRPSKSMAGAFYEQRNIFIMNLITIKKLLQFFWI